MHPAVRAVSMAGSARARRAFAPSTASALVQRNACAQQLLVVRLASSSTSAANGSSNGAAKFAWAETDMPPPSPGRGMLGRSANFDVTKRQGSLERWEWLLKLLGFFNEDDRLYRDSTRVFHSCVNQTAQPEYYRALQLTPNFRGQQALLLAHVWLLHRRLALEGSEGKIMQELMFDRLWEETVVRIRYLNVSEMTVNRHLGEVQQVCFNACIAYDRGLKEGTPVFQSMLAKHLLDNETPAGMRVAGVMAEHMKKELKNLEKVDAKYILQGTVPWSPHPQAPAAAKHEQHQEQEEEDEVTLVGQQFGNWRTALDNRGKLYYWNLTTRYSVWDRPTGDQLYEGVEKKN